MPLVKMIKQGKANGQSTKTILVSLAFTPVLFLMKWFKIGGKSGKKAGKLGGLTKKSVKKTKTTKTKATKSKTTDESKTGESGLASNAAKEGVAARQGTLECEGLVPEAAPAATPVATPVATPEAPEATQERNSTTTDQQQEWPSRSMIVSVVKDLSDRAKQVLSPKSATPAAARHDLSDQVAVDGGLHV